MINYQIKSQDLTRLKSKVDPSGFANGVEIALKRIGDEIQKDASSKAPVKSGNLRRSIGQEQGKLYVRVGTDVVYARIHEFGGVIRPKNSNYLKFKIDEQWIMTKKVTIKKRPYMTPAFERQKNGRAVDIITDELNRILSK